MKPLAWIEFSRSRAWTGKPPGCSYSSIQLTLVDWRRAELIIEPPLARRIDSAAGSSRLRAEPFTARARNEQTALPMRKEQLRQT
jgi:hypothetical protein